MKYILLILSTVTLISCQNKGESTEDFQQVETIQLIDNQVESTESGLKNIYTKNAVKVDKVGNVFHNQNAIMTYYQANNLSIETAEIIKSVLAGQDNNFEYEISQFENATGQLFKQVVIWDLSEEPKRRTFEFTAEAKAATDKKVILDERRNEWVYLCNEHHAAALIEEMYTENTVYYNHKPVIVGHDNLAVEYQYMNNESYELFLEPIIVETVQDNLVYEIGQCSGTYGGKYILIWQKGGDDVWRILVDSNI